MSANTNSVGFIVLRHVNNEKTNKYWNHCYDCIRNFYPENHILIIDDNSNDQFLSKRELYKTTIIKSEYPKRGELLPYYYYLQHKLFDTAVIIHDSVFINKHIDFSVDQYKMIWDFEHRWDEIEQETRLIRVFNDQNLTNFYNDKKLWTGCFGAMAVITHDYLKSINEQYNLSLLLDNIVTRNQRCAFERVIAVLLQMNSRQPTLLGNIQKYCAWGIQFENKENCRHLPMIKVWTGR